MHVATMRGERLRNGPKGSSRRGSCTPALMLPVARDYMLLPVRSSDVAGTPGLRSTASLALEVSRLPDRRSEPVTDLALLGCRSDL